MKTSSKIGLAAAVGMVALGGASLAFVNRGPEPSPEMRIATSPPMESRPKCRNVRRYWVVSDDFRPGIRRYAFRETVPAPG